MVTTRFIRDEVLWREILACVRKPDRKLAAVAYMATKSASLLPLQRRDRLVVDMSLDTVKRGSTDPREIRKLMQRGVEVFTRGSLHAKFIIAGKTLIAGSANVSPNSQKNLDEAGIITTEPVAVARAREFFDGLCTEPVRPEYLKRCIREYRPPQFNGSPSSVKRYQGLGRVRQAKLWFLGGLTELILSEADQESMEKVEARAAKKLKNQERTSVTWVRYGARRPKFMDHIRDGDWVIECTTDGGPRYVTTPAQVLRQDSWVSSRGARYEMLMLETPNAGETMPLSEFRKKVRRFAPALDQKNPRTRAIENDAHADHILRLWTQGGGVSKSRQ
jgi:hypothetical protein